MNPDLRDFLELVEREDPTDLLRVSSPVEPEYEVTSHALELERMKKTPVLLFEQIRGHNIPIVTNVLASRKRFAQALGVSEDSFMQEWTARSQRSIPPVELKTGPVKERIITGEALDLRKLPILKHFAQDGGPYITSGIVIAKHPHHGRRNASFHRLQLKGSRRLGISLHSRRHLWEYQRLAEDQHRALEVAVVIGAHPLFYMGSGLWKGPIETDEFNVAGGFIGAPLEICTCETVDLEVPVNGEIVIEGRILSDVREDEGPFGEFTGYASKNSTRHVLEVSAILQKERPVYQDIVPGLSAEHTLLLGMPQEVSIFEKVRSLVPTLQAVSYPRSGSCRFHCYMSLKKVAEGQPAHAIFAAFAEDPNVKLVIVVDEDIDVHDEREVLWAVATRFQANRDLFVASRCMGALLDPSGDDGVTAKMAIDATKPLTGWQAERCTIPEGVSHVVKEKLKSLLDPDHQKP
jgi:UbiD family decarboxylase